jgi:DNA repair protein SbcD/Mre11
MKFAHLADVHVGAWRDPAMKALGIKSFQMAVSFTIEKKADFAIIAGDLFNTAVPAIDHLQETVVLLKKLKKNNIPVYVVPGSHDFSASGKTIIDVLEEADLVINVMKGEMRDGVFDLKFTVDEKTGAKLCGIGGKRASLEKRDYEKLNLEPLEKEDGFKVFLFHTSIDELKPEHMTPMLSIPIKEFPKGFDYYAGGHVHVVQKTDFPNHKNVCYPGPVYPASFGELWGLGRGGFYFYDDGKVEHIPLNVKSIFKLDINAEGKTPEEVTQDILSKLKLKEFNNTIVLLRVKGTLKSGRPGDIDFKSIVKDIYTKGAHFVMRSTLHLQSKEFLHEKVHEGSSEDIEAEMIAAFEKDLKSGFSGTVVRSLIQTLSDEQKDGEKKYEYDSRIKKEADKVFE